MFLESISMLAEITDDSGNTIATGSLSLSSTPGELELKAQSLPRLSADTPVGVIAYTQEGVLAMSACNVSFSAPSLLGLCDVESVGYNLIYDLLYQNIRLKTYATKSRRIFGRGDPCDIHVFRLNTDECCFTTIEPQKEGTLLTLNSNTPVCLRELCIKVEKQTQLRNKALVYKARIVKLSRSNEKEIQFYLSTQG